MPVLATTNFGSIPYQPETVLVFPAGLPGFENKRQYLPVRLEESAPLIFLQSLDDPGLCFITVPVQAIVSGYRLTMTEEDIASVGLPPAPAPQPGQGVLCLVIVTVKEKGPTANLLAPLVINLANNRGVQAIAPASDYSWEFPIEQAAEAAVCS